MCESFKDENVVEIGNILCAPGPGLSLAEQYLDNLKFFQDNFILHPYIIIGWWGCRWPQRPIEAGYMGWDCYVRSIQYV